MKEKIYISMFILIIMLSIFICAIIKKSKILITIIIIFLLICILSVSVIKTKEKYTHKNLKILLKDIIEKFNKYKINYWIDYGTLLGIVRENDIIYYDSDIDICLHPDNPELEKKLIEIVKELKYGLTYNSKKSLFRIFQKNINVPILSVYADLYLTKLEKDYYTDCSGKLHKSLLGNTKKINWEGIDISVPEKIHETLIWRYGENYMTPIRNKPNERYKNILIEEGYKIFI